MLNFYRFEEAAESYMQLLTASPDKIIIHLTGGAMNNIDSSVEVVQKFTAEQVIKYLCLKIDGVYLY